MASNAEDDEEERERMVREVRFLFHGRFGDQEVRNIFDHVKWDMESAVKFVMESDPREVRSITGKSENIISELKTDPEVLDTLKNGIKSKIRQFACEPCDRSWWKTVPLRKEVSKCKLCKQKYDPVPSKYEWGWAAYQCECGRAFSGSGQMNTSSPCYTCERKVFPTKILPYRRRRYRKTTNTHCCDAPDCTAHDPVQIHEVDPSRVYDDGTDNSSSRSIDTAGSSSRPIDTPGSSSRPIDTAGSSSRSIDTADVTEQVGQLHIGKQKSQNASLITSDSAEQIYYKGYQPPSPSGQQNTERQRTRSKGTNTCVDLQSRQGKKKVVYPSERHISTGSTIGTFLSQGGDDASTYVPSLPSIPEHIRKGHSGKNK